MGLFNIDDTKLQAYWHRAWLEAGRGYVDFRKYPYLEHALIYYVIIRRDWIEELCGRSFTA